MKGDNYRAQTKQVFRSVFFLGFWEIEKEQGKNFSLYASPLFRIN